MPEKLKESMITMLYQMDNVSKEVKIIKKNQIEILICKYNWNEKMTTGAQQ